jgi:acyl-CoA synthetase (AMP-forming)/AMP-acid ligase II
MLGVWFAGGVLASLPLRSRGMDAEEYARQIRSICAQLDAPVLIAEEAVLARLSPWLRQSIHMVAWELADSGRIDPCPPGDDDVAFIQYSSGSTDSPKGCMLSPRAIASQLEVILNMIDGIPGEEVGLSWLPLSHDMGLFGGLLTPMMYGFEHFLSSPERFALSPRSWFCDVADTGATVTVGTNTALAYATRPWRKRPAQGSFHKMKALIIGAERVEWDTLLHLSDVLGPRGLRMESLMPAYGLAEATLAVTSTPVGEAPRYKNVDLLALAEGRVAHVPQDCPTATKIVSAGRPCPGVSIRGLCDSELKEVQVRSKSLTSGYYGDPARTEERLRPDGLLTGDLAFEDDGYLYVVGRTDDIISVGGRKVYAREIETAVEAVAEIREGTVTIVGRRGGKAARLALLVEGRARMPMSDCRGIAEKAAAIALAKAAVRLDECVFLERGSLPKTASGKVQRNRCLQLLEAGKLEPTTVLEF